MDHSKQITKRFGTEYFQIKSEEQIRTDEHNSKMKDAEHKRALQTRFGEQAFNIARRYLVVVGVFMVLCLFWNILHHKMFSDKVIIAILTTITTTVIGLPYIVLRGSFEAKEEKENKKNKNAHLSYN